MFSCGDRVAQSLVFCVIGDQLFSLLANTTKTSNNIIETLFE
jgi:hypothetical protein